MQPFMVHVPSFRLQQDMQSAAPVPNSTFGQHLQAHAQFHLWTAPGFVSMGSPSEAHSIARSALRHLKNMLLVPDNFATADMPDHFFSQSVLKHRLVARQVRNQPFQFIVFIFELLQSADFRNTHPGINLLPTIKRRLRTPHPTAELSDSCSGVRLPQRKGNLFIIEFFLRHRYTNFLARNVPKILHWVRTSFRGEDQST